MKKRVFVSVLAALVLSVSLVGCSNSSSTTDPNFLTSSEMEYTEIEWPDSDIAKLIPEPQSNIGNIYWKASYGFVIYIADTSLEEFNAYADACRDSGFNVDYQRGDDYYYADNADGYHLNLHIEDDGAMFIRMDEPDEESTTEQTTSSESSTPSQAETVDPDFKATMDNYESFMNEYCDFMERYNSSSNPTELLSDYSEYMTHYSELMTQISQIDTSSLSAADLAYYTEVTARVSQRLATIG